MRWQLYFRVRHTERACVSNDAAQRRGGRSFWTAQKHAVLTCPGAAWKVARHRAEAGATGRGRLAHADAAVAPGLMGAPACADEVAEETLGDKVFKYLARTWIDVEGYAIVHLLAPNDVRRDGEVAVARVGRRADVGLVDFRPGDLAHWHDVAGARRLGDQRFERGEVDLFVDVVSCAIVSEDFDPVLLAPFIAQEPARRRVRGKHRRGRPQLRAHVGDDVAVHGGQPGEAGTIVLDDAPEAALDAVPAQHLQDHVLGAHPIRQAASEAHAPDLRHA